MSKRSRERMMTGRSVQVRPEPGKLPKPARTAGPEPELREPMIPSKGYTLPPPRQHGTVHDQLSGRRLDVRSHLGYVLLVLDGHLICLDAARRDEFMRLWCEAETAAEAGNG